jgi:oligoribonuclease NrnB/cAMP/cGMP phosphodiesterase (DHH superfamily)
MRKLCIYHGKCADGFTAAWAVWKALGDDIEFSEGVYQNPPPDCTNRHVIMVDFSYKLPEMLSILERCTSLTVLDHHKTAKEVLDQLAAMQPDNLHVVFDLERSGAGITWDYYHPTSKRPALVNYVEDRDLWRFALPNSREVNAAIFSHDYSCGNWDALDQKLELDLDGIVAEGRSIERKHHKDVAELVGLLKRRMVIGGHEVWAANIPYTLTSDAGNLMAQGEPFAACYWDTPEGRVFSLRSTDAGLDVAEIAKGYGGGGHRNASGFRLSHGVDP